MNLGIRQKEREKQQGQWTKRPPGNEALYNFLNGMRGALGLSPIPGPGHGVHVSNRLGIGEHSARVTDGRTLVRGSQDSAR